jgi:O-methyltransferase
MSTLDYFRFFARSRSARSDDKEDRSKVPTMDLSRVDPFDPSEPYQILYREAINVAQGGKFDSLQKQFRFFMLYQAALAAVRQAPHLDFVECGCFYGHSTYMLATVLKQNGFRGEFHVFDSFEGLSEFSDSDICEYYINDEQIAKTRKHFASDETKFRNLFASFEFVRLHPGWIPTKFNEIRNRHLAFISIDVDLYAPTLESLNHLFPKLMPGGTVYLDDYGYKTFPGARIAVDEYLSSEGEARLLRMPFGSALLLK